MKPIKEYLTEGNFFGNLGIGKKAQIEEWLKKYKIKDYTINPDFTIDVKSEVYLLDYPDKELPEYIKFNYVKTFDISNSKISSFKGFPEVSDILICNNCNNITTFKDLPYKYCIYNSFLCKNCKNLKSLSNRILVSNTFDCSGCISLTSLEGAPKKVNYFKCNDCKGISSLKGAPEKCKDFSCKNCKVKFTIDDVKEVCDVNSMFIWT